MVWLLVVLAPAISELMTRWLPRDAPALRRRVVGLGIGARVGAGALSFATWAVVTLDACGPTLPALGSALVMMAGNALALALMVFGVGRERMSVSKVSFAVGMIAALRAWEVMLGALGYWVAALLLAASACLMFRLRRRVIFAASAGHLPPAAEGLG